LGSLRIGNNLPGKLADRVAKTLTYSKGNDEDREHDQKRLDQAPRSEANCREKRAHVSG
jgi:hypothetical protein